LITLGVNEESVLKKGSWYSYLTPDGEELSMGQGKNSAVSFLKDNPAIKIELENKIRTKHDIPLIPVEIPIETPNLEKKETEKDMGVLEPSENE